MRLVTWNAYKGRFDQKVPMLAGLRFDVAVVPEIYAPSIQSEKALWYGDDAQLGVAVVAGEKYRLRALQQLPDVPKHVVPVAVEGPASFILLAVWTHGEQPMKYIRALSTAVDMYSHLFEDNRVVVMGDFNSNAKWDREHPKNLNHSALVDRLTSKGLVSAYHHQRGEAHGGETEATFYFHWNEAMPHHIDYCFLPEAWAKSGLKVEIESFDAWKDKSDHRPLVVDVAAMG